MREDEIKELVGAACKQQADFERGLTVGVNFSMVVAAAMGEPAVLRRILEAGVPDHGFLVPAICFMLTVKHDGLVDKADVRQCLHVAIDFDCPVDVSEPACGMYVQRLVASMFTRVCADVAATTVQRAWLRAYYDPTRSVCQRRLLRQFQQLAS